jgi:hypothetical protein
MSICINSKRVPEVLAKFREDSKFRKAATVIASVIEGFSEQDARDAVLMAERLNMREYIIDNVVSLRVVK